MADKELGAMSSVQLIKVYSDYLSPNSANNHSFLSLLTPQNSEQMSNIGHMYE